MKQVIYALLLLITQLLAGCEALSLNPTNARLVGRWRVVSGYGYVGRSTIIAWQPIRSDLFWVFERDGGYRQEFFTQYRLPVGTYQLRANRQMTITVDGQPTTYRMVHRRDTLTLTEVAPAKIGGFFWAYKLVR